jgi:hypothetical protein
MQSIRRIGRLAAFSGFVPGDTYTVVPRLSLYAIQGIVCRPSSEAAYRTTTPVPICFPWIPIPRIPPPIFIRSTVWVMVFVSSLSKMAMTFRRLESNFSGQWQVSHVSRAGRKS